MTYTSLLVPLAPLALVVTVVRAGDFPDCNGNGVDDATDIATMTSLDCNQNGFPDDCDVAPPGDCGTLRPPPPGGGGGALGCDDTECRATVCAVDAFCCDTGWDDVCAREAQRLCGRSPDCNLNGIPDGCECYGDLDADSTIGFSDLNLLLEGWGGAALPDPPLPGDLDCSGNVGFTDLSLVLAGWGACPIPAD